MKTSTNKDIYLYISRQESKKEQIEMRGIYQYKCTIRSSGLQIEDQEN